jgi:3-oxoacyl-[acyl-carrier protein] reductase
MRNEQQRAVITGGSGTLAREIASCLDMSGWRIETPARDELDVTDDEGIGKFFAELPVELLVCAAGVTQDFPLLRLNTQTWDQTWAINFKGARSCAEAVLPGMIARGSGHIVFISSHSALHPPVGQSAYATAKAALLGLTADLAARHGASNIRVNTVLPGFMETQMTSKVTQSRRNQILAAHSLGRFSTCRQTASFISFLHRELPHTSGQIFQLDSRPDFP